MDNSVISCLIAMSFLLAHFPAPVLASSHRSPHLLSFTSRETNTCSDRSTTGLICQSCEMMASCLIINGEWHTVPVERCNTKDGFYCNLAKRGCSNETGPCMPAGFEGNFACTSQGVFPDPYDCQRYHMCYNAKSAIVSANIECGSDKAFSATTGDCSMSINDTVCTKPQYTCVHSGDSGSWPGNRNIFYICKALMYQGQRIFFPTLYRCGPGEVFNGRDCVDALDFVPEAKGSTEIVAPPSFKCPSNGLHPNPNDCRSYYYCDALLRMRKYTCPESTYFDNVRRACARGTC